MRRWERGHRNPAIQVRRAPHRDRTADNGRADRGADIAAAEPEPDPLTTHLPPPRKRVRRPSRRGLRNAAVAALAFAAAFFITQSWDFTIPTFGRAQYQAVFLANGQTYFGRFYDRIGGYAKIEGVYYLQQAQADSSAAPDTKLVRLGSELHGPAPRVLVPKSAILFVEDLSDASPIGQFMRRDRQ